MARPLSLFREYDFFGILLPGLATVVFFFMLLPKDIRISLSAGIVFVGVFAFVFGQALHSVALGLELLPEVIPVRFAWSHRRRFEKELNRAKTVDDATVKQFRREAAKLCPDIEYRDGFEPELYSADEAQEIYTYVRSYLHPREFSRAREIKPMYAFCRNSMVLFFGLIPLYWTYGFLDSSDESWLFDDLGIIDRTGKYDLFFPSYGEFLESALTLSFLGMLIFLLGTVVYQRFYVQYVFSDLVAHREEERQSPNGVTRRTRR